MVRGLSILVVLVELLVGTAFAQEVDARAALLASLKAMGGDTLKTIEITASGSSSLIGQQFSRRHQLAAVRGGQLHARHRLRRQVVARRLHAAAGQLRHLRPHADGRAARHVDRERRLCLGHPQQHAGAADASVSRRHPLRRTPAARAGHHAARLPQGGAGRHRTPRRSDSRSSARRTSASRSSGAR